MPHGVLTRRGRPWPGPVSVVACGERRSTGPHRRCRGPAPMSGLSRTLSARPVDAWRARVCVPRIITAGGIRSGRGGPGLDGSVRYRSATGSPRWSVLEPAGFGAPDGSQAGSRNRLPVTAARAVPVRTVRTCGSPGVTCPSSGVWRLSVRSYDSGRVRIPGTRARNRGLPLLARTG